MNVQDKKHFYLGKHYDLWNDTLIDEPLYYKSKDLTTHGMCVGMTGSGKTGLCIGLLEEAALQGIPMIIIDPKGDLGNLLLSFPDLKPEDFRPWVDEDEADRKGVSVDQHAEDTANMWTRGLVEWDQTPERIRQLRDRVDMRIYTPGSEAGIPLTVLNSLSVPSHELLQDRELLREKVSSTVSGLLTLAGIDSDPVQSEEHILVSTILTQQWLSRRDVTLTQLVRQIEKPDLRTVGAMSLEKFYPEKKRSKLAKELNNIIASPSFSGWMSGLPLNVEHLLYGNNKPYAAKPQISVISIAHLSEQERMFFVTILLNEVLAWTRTQPGTSSLRAILYMDEVAGYFPPVRNPPCKLPMLTLLKQARAYGLGCMLATQNPVDIDYKGLSNIGTWFIGRLQTERDKAKVMEGLEGAAIQAGQSFNKKRMEQTLAALGSRVFLLNNVHDNKPVTFMTRWTLSYLRGPLTRDHIKVLMDPHRPAPSFQTSLNKVNYVDANAPDNEEEPQLTDRDIRLNELKERLYELGKEINSQPKREKQSIKRTGLMRWLRLFTR